MWDLYKCKLNLMCFICRYAIYNYVCVSFTYIFYVQKYLLMKSVFSKKSLIISLIQDDLINTKLVYSLNNIGLQASDYTLHISGTVLKLVKIKTTPLRWEQIHDEYLRMTTRVLQIDIQESPRLVRALAEEIYNFLKDCRKREKGIHCK